MDSTNNNSPGPFPSAIAQQLAVWQNEVNTLCSLDIPCGKLNFTQTPIRLLASDYNQDDLDAWSAASTFKSNQGPLALVSITNQGNYANGMFLFVESSLCQIMSDLKMCSQAANLNEVEEIARDRLESSIVAELVRIDQVRRNQWDQQASDSSTSQGGTVYTEPYFQSRSPSNPVVRASTLNVLIQQTLFNSTRRASAIQIQSIKDTLSAAGADASVIDTIPNDPRTIQRLYNIDPILTTYLSCSGCFFLYDLDPEIRRCSQCNAELWKSTKIGDRSIDMPIRKYEHQKMEHWLGRLLSRQGIEEVIDNYRPDYSKTPWSSEEWIATDIMDSVIVHQLKDIDGSSFFDAPATEGRYIFSLAADGFNPFHSKEAKETAHSTGIWMVLLNLPPHLRYLPENVYLVGVIPGPRVPLIIRGQITPTLRLVVDDLCKFQNGVRFSRTYKYRTGRACKLACVVVVADTIALRELAGFASATSQFPCTLCWISHQDLQNLDRTNWTRRNLTDHIMRAVQWKNTENELAAQQKTFHRVHVRWSELNRLENFNVILQSPADSFHTWKLNALPEHCRKIWGISLKDEGGDGSQIDAEEENVEEDSSGQHKSRRRDRRMEDIIPYMVAICQSNFPELSTHAQQFIYDWHHTESGTVLPSPSVGPIPQEGGQARGRSRRNMHTPLENFQPNITDKHKYLLCIKNAYLLVHSPGVSTRKSMENSSNTLILRLLLTHCGLPDDPTLDKAEYIDLLLGWVEDYIPEFPPEYAKPSVRGKAVLGSDVMKEIYNDMKKTLLPSWVSPAPYDWGTPRRGKLSADEWGVIGLVHLPITLIRLWGVNSSSRKQEMLENFMHLVNAVRVGSMRQLKFSHILQYNFHVERYLSSLQKLYGSKEESVIQPHHHAMMHMGESMYYFGPVHSRNTSFSERYIYYMQQQNLNNKFGQLEGTFMRSCSRMGNLTALIREDPQSRKLMTRTLEALERLHKEDGRGTRTANLIDQNNTEASGKARPFRLSDNDLQSVARCLDDMYGGNYYSNVWDKLNREAGRIKDVSLRGVRFSIHSKNLGNSHALCRWENSFRAAQLEDIFTHNHIKPDSAEQAVIFCKVRNFLALQGEKATRYGALDQLYRKYGYGGLVGDLDSFQGRCVIVHSDNIMSHWARFTLENGVHAVIPLSQLDYIDYNV